MKTKFDLTNRIYKPIIDMYIEKCKIALDTTLELENAIFPIYALLKGNKPEHIGSGVLININRRFFIFSASHVFDSIGSYQMLLGISKGRLLMPLAGDRLSTARGKSGTHKDDSLDASVYIIETELPTDVERRALKINNLDISENKCNSNIHVIAGYRIKKSYSIGNKSYGRAEAFPSIRLGFEHYKSLNLNKEVHIALAYEKFTLVNGNKQKTPKLVGLSGGGIFRVKETLIPGRNGIEKKLEPLLTAITIQYEPKLPNREGAVVGTSILLHLSLLKKDMPDLFNY